MKHRALLVLPYDQGPPGTCTSSTTTKRREVTKNKHRNKTWGPHAALLMALYGKKKKVALM